MALLKKLYKIKINSPRASLRSVLKDNMFFSFLWKHKEKKNLAIALRLKASSLTEVLVATVIILIVFGIAITTLDNVLFNSVRNKTHFVETELNQLVYEYQHNTITLPFSYQEGDWLFNVIKTSENNTVIVLFEAKNSVTNKKITKKTIFNDIP